MPKEKQSKPIPFTNLHHIAVVEETLARRSGPSTGTPGRDRPRELRAAQGK